jgi:outer membrane lipoprotein-sorting protein
VLRAAFIIALLGVALTACKSGPTCPVQARTDAGQALADHAATKAGWRSLKAEARVTQWGGRGRIRGTVLIFLEQPNRVRFDVMTQVGPAAVLTSDGESFQLSDLRQGAFVHGPTCPENIARLLGISVDAEEVIRLLTGDTTTLDAVEESMECRDGFYLVTLVADRQKPPDAQRLTLRRSTVRGPNGEKRWEATYDDYIDVDGQAFPTNVRFVDEVNGADTAVRVKSISLDPNVPEGAFQQTPAPGMSIEIADCP